MVYSHWHDVEYDIGWPVWHFRNNPLYDATRPYCVPHDPRCKGGFPHAPAHGVQRLQRFRPRRISERSLQAAQAAIKQFVIHLDGCKDARMCYDVLHNERGLSTVEYTVLLVLAFLAYATALGFVLSEMKTYCNPQDFMGGLFR